MKIRYLMLIASFLLLPLCKASATERVLVGAYINGISDLDLKSGSAKIDAYIWFRSQNNLKILDTVEVMNGDKPETSSIVTKKIGKVFYSSERIQLDTRQIFNLKKFPLDHQILRIDLENSELDSNELQFEPDQNNTKVSESLVLPGWKIGKPTIKVIDKVYDTNYGDLTMGDNASSYSRAIIEIPIEREGMGYFFKLFGTVFLSAAVAFLSFYIRPDDLDPRFGLGVGGIFAVVASNFVLSSMLPETHEFTMGEALLLMTIVSIFIALLESVISLRYWEEGKTDAALKLDRYAGIYLPIAYVGFSAAIVFYYMRVSI